MKLLFNRTLGWVFYRDMERNGEVRNILNEIESSTIESKFNWTAFSIKWSQEKAVGSALDTGQLTNAGTGI